MKTIQEKLSAKMEDQETKIDFLVLNFDEFTESLFDDSENAMLYNVKRCGIDSIFKDITKEEQEYVDEFLKDWDFEDYCVTDIESDRESKYIN